MKPSTKNTSIKTEADLQAGKATRRRYLPVHLDEIEIQDRRYRLKLARVGLRMAMDDLKNRREIAKEAQEGIEARLTRLLDNEAPTIDLVDLLEAEDVTTCEWAGESKRLADIVKGHQGQITLLKSSIRTGCEYRLVPIIDEPQPATGQVVTLRTDTMKQVSVRPMTAEDRQQSLEGVA